MQGRLHNESLEVEIATSCAHCGLPMHIVVNEHFEWRVQEPGADPHLFLPTIDWPRFRAPNIIEDY